MQYKIIWQWFLKVICKKLSEPDIVIRLKSPKIFITSHNFFIFQSSLPMAETLWNITTTVQAICKHQQNTVSTLHDIPRSQLRLKESFGSGCLGEVIESKHIAHTLSPFRNLYLTHLYHMFVAEYFKLV